MVDLHLPGTVVERVLGHPLDLEPTADGEDPEAAGRLGVGVELAEPGQGEHLPDVADQSVELGRAGGGGAHAEHGTRLAGQLTTDDAIAQRDRLILVLD